ncbi:uncharacterized protein LOC113866200 [Abrus precatorius]|uniref:Uncharacterized protein LOC113866200 n=1 Tax=Abrus precatorius TaxID=3816 RepID=A0A8B8LNC2_ABRPR|nr:uncharacterized protein LOC113866200 [Abrus precatorius]
MKATTEQAMDIDISASATTLSFSKNEEKSQLNIPLLLQPSLAKSKSNNTVDELGNFRMSLQWCALEHTSCVGKLTSYVFFLFLTIAVPLFSFLFVRVPASASQLQPFSLIKLLQLPESGLAIIAFFTLSRFFRRYGLRQLLFLDVLQEDSMYVQRGYTRELQKAFRYLAFIMLPSFFVELGHKILLFLRVEISVPYITPGFTLNSIVFVLVLVSWVYRTGVFLLVCVLFRLTCELQILRFEGLHKLFEGCGSNASMIFREHVRIRRQLWVTSHRYRFFIIGCLVTITVSQLGSLLLVLESKSDTTFFNSGDLMICSAVQLSGFFLCLMGAARITHRAQGIVSIATRWHMLVTNASAASEQWKSQMQEGLASGSDSDSSDIRISVTPQTPSSFQTRQALVTYLQHNYGGITLFGFLLDRGLLHTLFAFEFSLVLWILSMVAI